MGVFTHHLETLTLLLHRIGVIAESIDLQFGSLDLTALTCSLTLYQLTLSTDTATCGDLLQQFLIKLAGINNDLYVLDGRTIIQGDKVNCLRAAVRTHPALHADVLTVFCAFQHIDNLSSFHLFSFLDIQVILV